MHVLNVEENDYTIFSIMKVIDAMSIDTFGSVCVVHGDCEANEACEAANWAALRVSMMWRNL